MLKSIDISKMKILDRDIAPHEKANLKFLLSFDNESLLQNFYFEAGIKEMGDKQANDLAGWEYVGCAIRGHFLGHYLSASSKAALYFGDKLLKAKVETIIDELRKCQIENGGKWISATSEKYLEWLKHDKNFRVPNYVLHKIIMGLFDAYKYLKYPLALECLLNMVEYIDEWSKPLSSEVMEIVLNNETGGLLEILIEVYNITKLEKHLALAKRFVRYKLFDLLISGVDALTNMHANTTAPEAVSVARMYEVTGDEYYRNAAVAYYDCAVKNRGYFVTGGNNSGECYIPPYRQLARMGEMTQEHCTTYNLVILADYLYRWTGDNNYADYIERCTYNSLLAQHNINTGTVSYFLPIEGGKKKGWCGARDSFPCCLGTVVQANATYADRFCYTDENNSLILTQLYEFQFDWQFDDGNVNIFFCRWNKEKDMVRVQNYRLNEYARPDEFEYKMYISSDVERNFSFKIRKPSWCIGHIEVMINDELITTTMHNDNILIECKMLKGVITIIIPRNLYIEKMSDAEMYAFMDCGKVLCGILPKEIKLYGDVSNVNTMLRPFAENSWGCWRYNYYSMNQNENFKLMPVCDVIDEQFTIYFPIEKKK